MFKRSALLLGIALVALALFRLMTTGGPVETVELPKKLHQLDVLDAQLRTEAHRSLAIEADNCADAQRILLRIEALAEQVAEPQSSLSATDRGRYGQQLDLWREMISSQEACLDRLGRALQSRLEASRRIEHILEGRTFGDIPADAGAGIQGDLESGSLEPGAQVAQTQGGDNTARHQPADSRLEGALELLETSPGSSARQLNVFVAKRAAARRDARAALDDLVALHTAAELDKLTTIWQDATYKAKVRQRHIIIGCTLFGLLLLILAALVPGKRFSTSGPAAANWQRVAASGFDAMFLLDDSGKVQDYNPVSERLFNLEQTDIVGQKFASALVPEAARDDWRKKLVRTSVDEEAGRIDQTLETYLLLPDGAEVPVRMALAAYDEGGARSTSIHIRDIRDELSVHRLEVAVKTTTSQLEQNTLELKISEARKTAILEAAIDCILTLDQRGCIVELNPASEEAFKISKEEALGMNLAELVPSLPKTEPATSLDAHGPTPGSGSEVPPPFRIPLGQRHEVVGIARDGTSFPAELILMRVKVKDAPLYTAYVSDITERKRIERMKNEFISIVSHELRTPLTSIRGSLGLLHGGVLGQLEPKVADLVRIALNNSERLIRLVNDMLDLEKMGAGKVVLRVETISAQELVKAAHAGVEGMASEAGIKLEQSISTDVEFAGDRDRLVQVLMNLLSNAIKFSEPGSIVVLEATTPREDRVRFDVVDQGPGIPADQLPKLFNRFEQLEASGRRAKRGSGLGLAISKAIVELHLGRINVESTQGEGSRFFFEIPLRQPGRAGADVPG